MKNNNVENFLLNILLRCPPKYTLQILLDTEISGRSRRGAQGHWHLVKKKMQKEDKPAGQVNPPTFRPF